MGSKADNYKMKRTLITISIVLGSLLTLIPNRATAAECATSSTFQSGYVYIAFKNAGALCTWTIPQDVTSVDYILVAGGGSGGSRHAGGGGAGGKLTGTNVSLSGITSLNVTVGSGGSSVIPSTYNYAVGLAGSDSIIAKGSGSASFTTITAKGGGGGESGGTGTQTGGSGGGSQSSTLSSGTAGQGNGGGGGGTNSSVWWAGGGGGAGANGETGTSTFGGAGGAGAIWISSFTTTVATALGLAQTNQISGDQVYFAGGGGGSISSGTSAGSGGLGGGGAAVTGNNTATSGTANSGGGGGGSGCCNGGYSGAGGSGVAIFRYPANAGLSLAISGTPFYRVSTTITASANIEGRVSFFANGRIIPSCRNLTTTSKSVSCTWKPAIHGKINLTASITSTSYSGYSGTAATAANASKRSNSR